MSRSCTEPRTSAIRRPLRSASSSTLLARSTRTNDADMKYGSESSASFRRSSVAVIVAATRSTRPPCRTPNRVAVVTGTSSTRRSSSKRTRAKSRARSISKPTGLPSASSEPNGGASDLTPTRSTPRARMVSKDDSAPATVARASTIATAIPGDRQRPIIRCFASRRCQIPRSSRMYGDAPTSEAPAVQRARSASSPAVSADRHCPRHGQPDLLAETPKSLSQRRAGDLDQPLEWSIQLEDQKDRARKRQRADEQGRDDCRVGPGEETEAPEDESEPADQHHQEGPGNRAGALADEQPARLAETRADRQRLGLERSLGVVLRRERLDRVIEGLRPGGR